MKALVYVSLAIPLSSCKNAKSGETVQAVNMQTTTSTPAFTSSSTSTEAPITLQDIKQIVIVTGGTPTTKGLALDSAQDAGIAVGSAAAFAAIVGAFAFVKFRKSSSAEKEVLVKEEEVRVQNPVYGKGKNLKNAPDFPSVSEHTNDPAPVASVGPAVKTPFPTGLQKWDVIAEGAQWKLLQGFKMIHGQRDKQVGVFILEEGNTEAKFFPVEKISLTNLTKMMDDGKGVVRVIGGGTLYISANTAARDILQKASESYAICVLIGAVALFCKIRT